MADTDFGKVTALQRRIYETAIWRQTRLASFFMSNGFMGSGMAQSNAIIHNVDSLTTTARGTEAIMPLVQDLYGDGVAGDNTLDGHEQEIEADSLSIRIDQLRQAVRNKGRMSEQKTVIRFRAVANDNLSYWLGDKIDELCFLTASGIAYSLYLDGRTRPASSQLPQLDFATDVSAPTSGRKAFAGVATTTGTLTANDTLTWNRVVQTRAMAKRRRMKPLRKGGKEYFVLVVSNEQCRDLKLDPDYKAAVANAEKRGSDNPLFQNAMVTIDGILIYEHEKVANTLGLTSTSKWGAGGLVDGAQALMMGAQALGFASTTPATFDTSDNTDYQNKTGIAVGRMFGLVKPHWYRPEEASEQDYSIISLYTAAAAVS